MVNMIFGLIHSTLLFGLCYFGQIPSLLPFLANEIRLSKGLPVFRNFASNSGSILTMLEMFNRPSGVVY